MITLQAIYNLAGVITIMSISILLWSQTRVTVRGHFFSENSSTALRNKIPFSGSFFVEFISDVVEGNKLLCMRDFHDITVKDYSVRKV